MTRRTSHLAVPPLRYPTITDFAMRVLVILSIISAVTLASGRRLIAVKRRRESKWDIIHHEYHGPPAPLSKRGEVIDTEEVALAKANHLAIHAETAADLARKMAEANAEEAKWKANSEAAPIVVAEPVQMTPELMAMLMAAAAEEQKQGEEEKQVEEVAAVAEAAPEAPKEEAAPAPVSEVPSEGSAEKSAAEEKPAEEAPAAGSAETPAADAPAAAPAAASAEAPKQEEAQAVVETDANNEVEGSHPRYVLMRSYEGPLAPLDHIGRVVETEEVKKAREDHYAAFRQAIELAKAKEEQWKQENASAEKENQETNKQVYINSPPIVHFLYQQAPVGYKGPQAPLGKDGRVVDTEAIVKAKEAHKKALEHAEAIAKRHPPKPEDNLV